MSFALALLYPLVAVGNARADDANPAAVSAVNSALQAVDEATGSGDVDTTALLGEPVPAALSQQASIEQAASAAAAATQQLPRNLVISIRINSPGNDGPISQTNVAGSGAGASNDASTGQGGAPGAQQPSQQQATTDQAGTATATATQAQPQNIVILIRINSPGNNGPIDQTNTAVAVSNAGNASVTTQGESGNGADGTAIGASPDQRAAIGPPAQQAASPAPMKAVAAGHRIDRPAPAAPTAHRPAGDRANSAPSSRQTVSFAPSDPPAAVKSPARAPLAPVKSARRSAAVRGDGQPSQDPSVGRRAVDLLGKLAPRSPVRASGGSDKDVTNAVLFTVIAVIGAFVVFFGSTYLSSGLQLLPRSRRHG